MLTSRFVAALVYATERHEGQTRKGTTIPYVSHLLGTCALVLEAGGNEDEAIAALLHDVIEDTDVTYEDLVREFGEEVADIVRACSDTEETPKPPWRKRKETYLEELPDHSPSAILVSNADKLHNLRTIIADYRVHGEDMWSRFNPDRDTLWYYTELAKVFEGVGSPLAGELRAGLDELTAMIDLRQG